MTFLISDQDAGGGLRSRVGGKAHNLFELTSAGFPVPRWAVLGVEAFDTALAAAGVRLSDAPLTLSERFTEAEYAESAVNELVIPEQIREDIFAAVEYAGGGNVAVRSSGRAEDGAANSFAGLFDTFLNVAGIAETEAAVRRCWASTFSRRATRYRQMRGLDFSDVAVAVIVQRLVQPVCSGVIFTADPVTGAADRIVINAVLGLGEGLVSGAVDSDSVVVDKRTAAVIEETVTTKAQMIVAAAAGGVHTADVPRERRQVSSIDADLSARLAGLGSQLEQHFGAPQDIEWAVGDDAQAWILQSRPITTIEREKSFTAEHFGETVAAGQQRIWDNSNIIESFAGVTSPPPEPCTPTCTANTPAA